MSPSFVVRTVPLSAAYHRGKHSQNFLGVDYGELWTAPVSELAERLCQPARSSPA